MNAIQQFLNREQEAAGWRFYVLWVLVTNIGFSFGLVLESLIFGQTIIYLATILQGICQAWVLARHFEEERGEWAVATGVGWLAGGFLAQVVLDRFLPGRSFGLNLVLFALIAGAVTGVPQMWVLRRYLPKIGWWWVPIAAIGWAVQFPGAVAGLPLVRLIPARK